MLSICPQMKFTTQRIVSNKFFSGKKQSKFWEFDHLTNTTINLFYYRQGFDLAHPEDIKIQTDLFYNLISYRHLWLSNILHKKCFHLSQFIPYRGQMVDTLAWCMSRMQHDDRQHEVKPKKKVQGVRLGPRDPRIPGRFMSSPHGVLKSKSSVGPIKEESNGKLE